MNENEIYEITSNEKQEEMLEYYKKNFRGIGYDWS